MRQMEMLYALCEQHEYVIVWDQNCPVESMFGEGSYLYGESAMSAHPHACVYSDTKNPFEGVQPDAIWVLSEDGRCIFMYDMEG